MLTSPSTIDSYTGSNGVRTPNASFNAAYDWMLSTGQAVDAATSPLVPAGERDRAVERHLEPPGRQGRDAAGGAWVRVDQRPFEHVAVAVGR